MKVNRLVTALALAGLVFSAGEMSAQSSYPEIRENRRLDSLETVNREQRIQATSDADVLSDLKSKRKDTRQDAKEAQRIETDASNSAKASKRAYKNEKKAQKSRRHADADAKKAATAKRKADGNH